jgi:serine protease AprX
LPGQNLVGQVVDDEPVAAGERRNEASNLISVGDATQGERGELQTGDPALRTVLQRVHVGGGELQLSAALAAPLPTFTQFWAHSTGIGSLELARGLDHISMDGVVLDGERDIMGSTFNAAEMALVEAQAKSWSGGDWNAKTWSGETWSGDAWEAKTWSGDSWSAKTWSSCVFSSNVWEAKTWSAKTWSGDSWSGASWSGGVWATESWS